LPDWPRNATPYDVSTVRQATSAVVDPRPVKLKDPTDYLGIFRAAGALLVELSRDTPVEGVAIHTSPGTSPMSAVWVLLAKTKYAGAKLFKSWVDPDGRLHLADVEIPFELTQNFSLGKELESVERRLIEPALRESDGVQERSAKLLGTRSRQALAHRIRNLGIGG